jgi:hypothetical protein
VKTHGGIWAALSHGCSGDSHLAPSLQKLYFGSGWRDRDQIYSYLKTLYTSKQQFARHCVLDSKASWCLRNGNNGVSLPVCPVYCRDTVPGPRIRKGKIWGSPIWKDRARRLGDQGQSPGEERAAQRKSPESSLMWEKKMRLEKGPLERTKASILDAHIGQGCVCSHHASWETQVPGTLDPSFHLTNLNRKAKLTTT